MQQQKHQLLSITDYARLRGLNKSTISRQVRAGVIPAHSGKVDPVEADAGRIRNLDPAKRLAAATRKWGSKPGTATRGPDHPAAAESDAVDRGRRSVIDRLLANGPDLSAVLAKVGASTPFVVAAPDLLLSFLWAALDTDDMLTRLYGEGGPEPAARELTAIAAEVGRPWDDALEAETERLSEEFMRLMMAGADGQ